MTKIELVRAVCQKTGIDQPTVMAALDGLIATIKESLVGRTNVYLRGWGTWTLKRRAQKTARNISQNTTIIVEAHDIPYFKPSKDFVNAVAEGGIVAQVQPSCFDAVGTRVVTGSVERGFAAANLDEVGVGGDDSVPSPFFGIAHLPSVGTALAVIGE